MNIDSRRSRIVTAAGLLILALTALPGFAQEPKSGPLAKELSALLDARKLTTIAAKDSKEQDQFVAAMYFPGSQLLVVAARYAVPLLLDEKIGQEKYMDVYIDLNSASVPETKVFVSDLKADGLQARPGDGEPFDTVESGGTQMPFNRNWKQRKMSEDEYMEQFRQADERYAQLLAVLLNQLEKQ
jgi:hypothetical protein